MKTGENTQHTKWVRMNWRNIRTLQVEIDLAIEFVEMRFFRFIVQRDTVRRMKRGSLCCFVGGAAGDVMKNGIRV